MINPIRSAMIALLAVFCIPVANAQATKEQYLVCAGYYYTLSFIPSEFMYDLTEEQARQAAFAMMHKVNPNYASPQAAQALADSWTQQSSTLQQPYTQEKVSAFREVRDAACRPLLKQAWCDAYGVASACDD
jgi:hypothetical protein